MEKHIHELCLKLSKTVGILSKVIHFVNQDTGILIICSTTLLFILFLSMVFMLGS